MTPKAEYPTFDYSYVTESLGLTEEDVAEFLGELSEQLNASMEAYENALETNDIAQLQNTTEELLQVASGVGSGGVSDVLADFNEYLQNYSDPDTIMAYFELLIDTTIELRDIVEDIESFGGEEESTEIVNANLPECNYPPYDHSRMVETLGLGDEDAREFVQDLIGQIDNTLTPLKTSIDAQDFEGMEAHTHSIKGSATNIGTGGVADLLTEFNTYLKTGTDMEIINHYYNELERYAQELKTQYS